MPIVYFVCNECNMYHSNKRVAPKACMRCGSPSFEKITINDPSFNYVMKIAQSLRGKNNISKT